MKPVSYHSVPSSVNGGHQNLGLDRVRCESDVMYCGKCGFPSKDAAVFEKHMLEHMGTRFYCFYCNNVFFSEAELNTHLKQHTTNYPYKCQYCGQGYMRRLCLVKHIDRLHKNISQGPAKPDVVKISHVPVSSALSSVSSADSLSFRPAVRVSAPVQRAPAVRVNKDELRAKALDCNVSNTTNGHTEHLSLLNGPIQHNRALTVSLPEEVTIPAGCLVELVEVKTVNGTKELKLRLVSQQENKSVIKDTRTTVSQNAALGKPLSSALNHQIGTVKTGSMGRCTVNRRRCETKTVNVERPVSKNLPSQVSNEKSGFKRTSQEIFSMDSNTVIPCKIPKITIRSAREGTSGIRVTQREPVSLVNAASSSVISTRVANRLTNTLHPDNRTVEERRDVIQAHSKSIPPQRASDTKSIHRDVLAAFKQELTVIQTRKNIDSKIMKDTVGLNQPCLKSAPAPLSVPAATAAQVRPPAVSGGKNSVVVNQSFPAQRTLNETSSANGPVLSNANSKVSAWSHNVRLSERAGEGDETEPESFPVISSVFSLSQQMSQTSFQPLVMALRGIVMDKSNGSGRTPQDHIKITNGTEQMREAPASGPAQVTAKEEPSICCPDVTEWSIDSVKVEELEKGVQPHPVLTSHHIHVKVEKNSSTPTDDDNKFSLTLASTCPTDKGLDSEIMSHVDASVSTDDLRQTTKRERDVSSKFLTVSLRRVQLGVWENNRKGPKLSDFHISKCETHLPVGSVTDCAVIYLMPLKVDQLVRRPGPNQPVVVLNHPKPRAPVQETGADTVANTGASVVVPKCQILKMKLSKVMGQKYEVKGCTVRVCP
ncbi:zinc finger protein 518B [Solea senegalensis]|uniref:Zinc finger protein 518B n=1 Tax=Solea senegalensis TaxID=28829 RepID=A0AAV6SPI2_SOLSE|nr:uncharacterized protein LOC122778382 [Solea senegalensis]KAG7519004.1 zinc finger protein 518B [Solea senegalensis]